MCRYSQYGPYKARFACFACQKAFKQLSISEWLGDRDWGYLYAELAGRHWTKNGWERPKLLLGARLDELESLYSAAAHGCPECGEPMAVMGRDFKKSRHADAKAWRILAGLYHIGKSFHTCGFVGPGYGPESMPAYRDYWGK